MKADGSLGFHGRGGGALALALLVGCAAGQTGQEDEGEGCPGEPEIISPETDVRGVVPLEVALIMEGTYVSPLVWSDGDSDGANDTPEDEVTVRLAYDEGPARLDRCDHLQIEMAVEVTTRDSGVNDSGKAWMDTYRLRPDPTYSPEFGITSPNYARAALSLKSTSVYAYELPSGVTLTGTVTGDGADERYGYYPAMPLDCIGSADTSTLNPNPERILSFLNGLSLEGIAWQGPDVALERVQFRAESSGCDEFGIGRVPLVGHFTFAGAEPIALKGELTLMHRAEDPEVVSMVVSADGRETVEGTSVTQRDGSSCFISGVHLSVEALRLASDETPFEVVEASAHAGCHDEPLFIPPGEAAPPGEN